MKLLPNIKDPRDFREFSDDQLVELAAEVRQEIVSTVAETGGHLGSNLGAVELTIALHHVFNTPSDRIIWDVSHQTYAHKMLTGRREELHTLRKYHGLAGYCKRTESAHDHFGAGHASTSISAALGFAAARDATGLDHKVVAVIGDGAMTGGLAFEGMNNAGSLGSDLLVILNDNTWSISKNVGSLSKYLTTIMADEKFNKLRKEVWELTGRFKRRDKIRETISRLEKSIKGLLVPGMLFDKLGFRYFGPIDGHDLPLLVKTLKDVKNLSGPIMLHVGTVKGKGFEPAETDAYRLHGVGKFDKVTGRAAASGEPLPSYTSVYGKTIIELATRHDKVMAITAAMSSGTGLDDFAKAYPNRFFDVGIAEGHGACFAAALAAEGARPYLTVYSTFMQRAYDQVIHDMAIQKLPVVICMDRGGLVGNDGPTHHGVFDLAYLRAVPEVVVAAPKDGNELRAMMHYTANNKLSGVTAIRFPRDTVPVPMTAQVEKIDWLKWERLNRVEDIVILPVGAMVREALAASEALAKRGIKVSVVNARFVKPFDTTMLEDIRRRATHIVTIEEGTLCGGFGQGVAEYLLSRGFTGVFKAIGLDDIFVTHGSRAELLHEVGLDAAGLATTIEKVAQKGANGKSDGNGSLLKRFTLRRKPVTVVTDQAGSDS